MNRLARKRGLVVVLHDGGFVQEPPPMHVRRFTVALVADPTQDGKARCHERGDRGRSSPGRSWPLVVGTFRARRGTRRGGTLGTRALLITRLRKIGWSAASRRARKSVGTLPAYTTGEADRRSCRRRCNPMRCVVDSASAGRRRGASAGRGCEARCAAEECSPSCRIRFEAPSSVHPVAVQFRASPVTKRGMQPYDKQPYDFRA